MASTAFSPSCLALAGAILICAQNAPAAVLMLDFGVTTVPAGQQTNSPYHTASGGAFTGTSWNQVQTADTSSLVYSDGSAASGLSLNLGASTTGTMTLTNQPDTSLALGSSTFNGIYTTGSVGRDGIFEGTQTNTTFVGFQLTGLAAGTYELFVTARNTNASPDAYSQRVYVAAGDSGNFAYAGFDNALLSFSGENTNTAAWVEDVNYLKFTVTLTAGQALNLAVAGGGGQTRGFLNSVQIVAVPEPTQGALLGLALLGSAGFIRRRRRE